MGLGPGDLQQGLRLGAAASATGAALAVLAISHPPTRAVLRDERAVVTSERGGWRRVLLRFPLGTALFEEVAFRGVLSALLRRTHRPGPAEALSAASFGLWHLIPTSRALAGNPLGRDVSVVQGLALILGGSIAAGASGLGLARMRRNTGSLLAPWLVHSSFNSLSYLAGVAALRLGTAEGSTCPPRDMIRP
jgi:membrane protease YdiL (CAAX protease family)